MGTGAAVMDIAERTRNRVRAGTVGRQKEQSKSRMARPPLLNGFGFMDLIVIHDDIEPRVLLGGITLIEDPEQITTQGIGFARPKAVVQRAGSQIEGSG